MRRKVIWLFIWMNFAFWVGCAGENQNYKINQERTPIYREGYPTQPGGENPIGSPVSAPVSPDAPSLSGLDRSHWTTIRVAVAEGRVLHHPHYFPRSERESATSPKYRYRPDAWRATSDTLSPLSASGDIEYQAAAATASARDPIGQGGHHLDLILAPAEACFDIGTLGVRAIFLERPWDWRISPQE